MTELEKQLEKVITIDGRGRPSKIELFFKLIEGFGIENVLKELKLIQETRKF